MKFRSILLAGLVALAPFSAFAAGPSPLATVFNEMLSPVVQLNRSCSASVIRSDIDLVSLETTTILLTAKHCVADSRNKTQDVYVPVYQGNRIVREDLYKAKVRSVSVDYDLALVQLIDKTATLPTVQLAPSDVALFEGEETWTVGWPKGLVRTITSGSFGNRADMPYPDPSKDTEYFRSTPSITGGNSGGALFHKTQSGVYEQIGVTSAGFRDVEFMNFYVPIDQIHVYLIKDKTLVDPSKLVISQRSAS